MFFGMNTEQVMGLVRQLLPVLGTLATTFGWLTPDQVASGTATILAVIGPLMIVASTLWSLFSKTNTAIVSSASAVPNVDKIVLNSAVPGTNAMAKATPNNVVIQ